MRSILIPSSVDFYASFVNRKIMSCIPWESNSICDHNTDFFIFIDHTVKMSTSGLKAIAPVPTAADFLDIVLSKTQRKTPTVCRQRLC